MCASVLEGVLLGVGVVVSGLATPEYPAETVGTIMLRCTVPLARLP